MPDSCQLDDSAALSAMRQRVNRILSLYGGEWAPGSLRHSMWRSVKLGRVFLFEYTSDRPHHIECRLDGNYVFIEEGGLVRFCNLDLLMVTTKLLDTAMLLDDLASV